MLFHALWEKGPEVDIQQYSIDPHETLDVEKFQRAWWRIIARHPVLRTRFRWEDRHNNRCAQKLRCHGNNGVGAGRPKKYKYSFQLRIHMDS
jgi:hypothetical protein